MMTWLVIVLIATAALILLVQPFLRRKKENPALDERDYLAAQMKEIEDRQSAGILSAEEAEAAKLETGRRLLEAEKEIGGGTIHRNAGRRCADCSDCGLYGARQSGA